MNGTALADVLPAEALADGWDTDGVVAALSLGAEAVVRPQSTEEVAETLRWATAGSVGVLPVGSGERLRRPNLEGRFILLVTDRLSGLEIYEPADVTFTAKAGTLLSHVNRELGAHRQWLPFDPPGAPGRTLGGLVATGESGPIATGYGALRNHVLGATVVCGDGRVLRLGGRVVKNVAGFDLLRTVVGSRGRLGVVTSVCMRAFPIPAVDRVLVFRAADVSGLESVARAVRTAPVLPAASIVWSPAASVGAAAALMVRLHGALPTVDADQATLERHAGVSFERPTSQAVASHEVREHAGGGPVGLRVSLLASHLFAGLSAARDLLGDQPIMADSYNGWARLTVDAVDPVAVPRLREAVEALGGSLSVAALADGADRPDPGSRPNADELELAGRIEQVFDPAGVFWPCRP